MSIKYKTKLNKTSALKLKQQLWEYLSKCDIPRVQGQNDEQLFIIYHAIKVIKLPNDMYSVKIYEKLSGDRERMMEVDNLYILHLLVKDIVNEIEVT